MDHEILQSALFVLHSVLLVLLVFTLAIALVSFKVLLWQASTRIHHNLRAVLIAQNAAITGYCFSMICYGVNQFSVGPNFFYTPPGFFAAATFFGQFVILIGHVLLLERALATLFVDSYEQHWKRPYFTVVWATILTMICVWVALSGTMGLNSADILQSNSITTIATNVSVFLISFIEILVNIYYLLWKLGLYNASKYSTNLFYARQKHTLSARYQLSENVRTIRQLGPIFVAHFVLCAIAFVAYGLQMYVPMSDILFATLFALFTVLFVTADLAILICVILFHPVLRQKARQIKRRAFCCFRVNKVQQNERIQEGNLQTLGHQQQQTQCENLEKQPQSLSPEGAKYFSMLRAQWN